VNITSNKRAVKIADGALPGEDPFQAGTVEAMGMRNRGPPGLTDQDQPPMIVPRGVVMLVNQLTKVGTGEMQCEEDVVREGTAQDSLVNDKKALAPRSMTRSQQGANLAIAPTISNQSQEKKEPPDGEVRTEIGEDLDREVQGLDPEVEDPDRGPGEEDQDLDQEGEDPGRESEAGVVMISTVYSPSCLVLVLAVSKGNVSHPRSRRKPRRWRQSLLMKSSGKSGSG